MKRGILVILFIGLTLISVSSCEFSPESCVETHNKLRQLHEDTHNVVLSDSLLGLAEAYADNLRFQDTSETKYPVPEIPIRKRRNIEDGIEPDVHLESWEGDITYPSAKDGWLDKINRNRDIKIGRNIHKFCCTSDPHCPKEFFHNLQFPPSAEEVVNDIYNEEMVHYDFERGTSESIYYLIEHFARIVWKNTTEIGCAQSRKTRDGCVFTIMLYKSEGASGDEENYKMNIGNRKMKPEDNRVETILLCLFLLGIFIAIVILIYRCRHNIEEKYHAAMISVEVMKAEQELATDSTRLWWTRAICMGQKERPASVSRPKNYSRKEKPAILMVPSTSPRPSLVPPSRPAYIPPVMHKTDDKETITHLLNQYKGMSLKRADYVSIKHCDRPPPPVRPVPLKPRGVKELARQPSLSGKSVPPPAPPVNKLIKPVAPPARPSHSPKRPTDPTLPKSDIKPQAAPRKNMPPTMKEDLPFAAGKRDLPPIQKEGSPSVPKRRSGSSIPKEDSSSQLKKDSPASEVKKPLMPPKKPYRSSEKPDNVDAGTSENKPMSIAERKRLLEGN